CTPCRTGCEKAVKLMQADAWDTDLLTDLCDVMADASICGLGQAAPNPIRLVMKHFLDEIVHPRQDATQHYGTEQALENRED
ncbi:NADH-ubiquinone oxidoreductase-F iron-sulfur binding region domain-containing protein, partial [Cribrihabitans sp. XS_ASV171]